MKYFVRVVDNPENDFEEVEAETPEEAVCVHAEDFSNEHCNQYSGPIEVKGQGVFHAVPHTTWVVLHRDPTK